MGLDAFIVCDCFEKGRLLEPPPAGTSLKVQPDGSLGREQPDGTLELDIAWDAWRSQRACVHPHGTLLHHRLGNVALIGLLRTKLEQRTQDFPILVSKVVYDGVHGGDYLPVEAMPALQRELDLLREFQCTDDHASEIMSEFRAKWRNW